MGIRSANPLLANIEDMLIEEASAEEDELLGRNDEPESQRQASITRMKVGFTKTFIFLCEIL